MRRSDDTFPSSGWARAGSTGLRWKTVDLRTLQVSLLFLTLLILPTKLKRSERVCIVCDTVSERSSGDNFRESETWNALTNVSVKMLTRIDAEGLVCFRAIATLRIRFSKPGILEHVGS